MTYRERHELYRFGYFDLNVTALELHRQETRVTLTGKPFQLLVYLIRHRHRVLSKKEIYEQVWRSQWDPSLGNVVEAALTVLRSALSNDDPKEPRYVRTIRGHGIRFIADVTETKPQPFPERSGPSVDRVSKLLARGWHSWSLRTKEGFWNAVACFDEARQIAPDSLAAFEGLATAYLMLGTYSLYDPAPAYEKFVSANLRAVELGGWTPRLSTNHAHALHLFQKRVPEAEAILIECAESGQAVIETYLALTMLHAGKGQWALASKALQAASHLNELWPSLPALRTFLEFMSGRFETAVKEGWAAVELHPYNTLGRAYLAQALESSGDFDSAVNQLQVACSLSPGTPWLELLLARSLAKCERTAEAETIASKIAVLGKGSAYVDDYYAALALEGLGRNVEALTSLERAVARRSVSLFMLNVDPRWDRLRCNSRFTSICTAGSEERKLNLASR